MRLLPFVLAIPIAIAGVISGTIYDNSLMPVDAIMVVNTTPEQVIVAKGGSYSFYADPGKYRMEITLPETGSNINVTIVAGEHDIVRDIVVPEDLGDLPESRKPFPWIPMLAGLAVSVAGVSFFLLKRKREMPEELEKIIEEIRKEDGRILQKDLKKRLPWSEAKVSMMLSELEEMGIVKRIKKGRAKIVVLRK